MKLPYRFFRVDIENETFDETAKTPIKAVEAALKKANPPPFYTVKVYEYENGKYSFITQMGGVL